MCNLCRDSGLGIRDSGFAADESLRSPNPEARIPSVSLPLHPRNYFFADVLRRRLVPIEVHRIGGASLRPRPEIGRIAEHFRQRHARLDDLRAAAIFLRLYVAAPAGE